MALAQNSGRPAKMGTILFPAGRERREVLGKAARRGAEPGRSWNSTVRRSGNHAWPSRKGGVVLLTPSAEGDSRRAGEAAEAALPHALGTSRLLLEPVLAAARGAADGSAGLEETLTALAAEPQGAAQAGGRGTGAHTPGAGTGPDLRQAQSAVRGVQELFVQTADGRGRQGCASVIRSGAWRSPSGRVYDAGERSRAARWTTTTFRPKACGCWRVADSAGTLSPPVPTPDGR